MADYLSDANLSAEEQMANKIRGISPLASRLAGQIEQGAYGGTGVPNPLGAGPSFMPTSGRIAVPRGTPTTGAPATGAPAPAGPISVTDQWNQAAAASAAGTQRNQQLYDMLLGRAQQSLTVDPNDPAFRAQIDTFTAGQERARRSYLADAAEAGGPGANLTGEARLANEKFGQNLSSFRADLSARELSTRRQEIAGALGMMGDMLSGEQQMALQRELSVMDRMLKERELGITEADRRAYYDALKRGYFKD